MKAITVATKGAPWTVSTDVPVPEPADGEILVKSIFVAINPVEGMMSNMGLLVVDWPFVPGCDTGGVVVKAGKDAVAATGTAFKPGDRVFGCTRLGTAGYTPFQEYFLMEARLATPVPEKISLAGACTLGAAVYTAALGIFGELEEPIPKKNTPEKDEWALVFGGASSVGKAAVELFKASGYKVIATGSPSSFDMMKATGVDACVSYKQKDDEMIAEIVKQTGGKLHRVFDAVAQNNALSVPLFEALGDNGEKWFAGTNDWDEQPTLKSVNYRKISLGPIGRPESVEVNKRVQSYIPFFYEALADGRIKPQPSVKIGGVGLEAVIEAYEYQGSGKGGNKKVIAQVAEE